MNIHLINDSNITRGGAQKIVNELGNIPNSIVLDKNSPSDIWFTKFKFKFSWIIDLIWIISRCKDPKIIMHSRCFFILLPYFKIKNINCIFYCHAQYRSFKFLFGFLSFKRYICVSNSTKDYLIGCNVRSDIIDVVSNPILSLSRDIDSIKYDFGKREYAYIGSLEPWKGILDLVKLLELHGRINSLTSTLYVVGKGSLESELEQMKVELNYVELVFFGYKEDPFSAIKLVPIVIIPSLEEGFGLVAIESRYKNKIVIFNNIAALNEVCRQDSLCIPYDNSDFSSFNHALILSKTLISKLHDKRNGLKRRDVISKEFGLARFKNKVSFILK
ncbi:hypothetical protein CWO27_11535 [Vibrio sp. 10N.286.51.C3]|uniref:glycosyltransferase n=1 Tax=unclassified Vibrio TaxID=2614977 RepID=UPI000D3AACAF|nr:MULTISPECIES: glycosyltransferase [unclassified Vibrio]PTP14235.1 hypothetical protein CWO27_11535 [Vibrio sp. 10N.286.51.C3]TKE67240.1 glycosyltransferase family 4 protein [Vibrio sp. F12]